MEVLFIKTLEKLRKNKKAFTLIELIVVIAVLALLVLLALPRLLGQTEDAVRAQITHDIRVAESKMYSHLVDNENLDDWNSSISREQLNEMVNDQTLYERSGLVEYPINNGDFSIIPEEFIKSEVGSSLDGDFYSDEDGKVYYNHDKVLSGGDSSEEEEDLTSNWNRVIDGSDGDYPEWTEQELFAHEIVDGQYAKITGYYGANPENSFREELDVVIPEQITEGGIEYPVEVIGEYSLSPYKYFDEESTIENLLRTVHIPNTVIEIESYAFAFQGNITESAHLGKNIEKIGMMAFSDIGFERLVTTRSLVELADAAFGNRQSELKNLDMSYSVNLKELPNHMINQTTNITSFKFPPNLEIINNRALAGLASPIIDIPESVHTIDKMPFGGQSEMSEIEEINIKNINHLRLTLDELTDTLNSITSYQDTDARLRFEQPYLFDEETQTILYYWHEGQDRDVVIPSEINGTKVKHIGEKAFYKWNLANWHLSRENIIDSVVIPESIETIGNEAFSDYYSEFGQYKDGIIFKGENIKHIGEGTFHGAGTVDFRLPNSIETIDKDVFLSARMESINIPHSLRVIPENFMSGKQEKDQNLKEVLIDENNIHLEIIEEGAFSGTHISEFYVPNNVKEIRENAFRETNITEIEIPHETEVHENAFDEGVTIIRK